jgi:hypothetical protein
VNQTLPSGEIPPNSQNIESFYKDSSCKPSFAIKILEAPSATAAPLRREKNLPFPMYEFGNRAAVEDGATKYWDSRPKESEVLVCVVNQDS